MSYSSDNFPSNSLFTSNILSIIGEKIRHSFKKAIPFEAFLNVRIILSFLKLNAKGLVPTAQHWKLLIVLIHCSIRHTCVTVVVILLL